MAKETVKIILTESKAINGKIRKAGIILMKGFCGKNITVKSLDKAIQLNQVKVEAIGEVEVDEEASDGARE